MSFETVLRSCKNLFISYLFFYHINSKILSLFFNIYVLFTFYFKIYDVYFNIIILTIRPSPLPRSIKEPERPFNAWITFFICWCVAGTYGKHILRNAGLTNEKQTTLIAVAIPPNNVKSWIKLSLNISTRNENVDMM